MQSPMGFKAVRTPLVGFFARRPDQGCAGMCSARVPTTPTIVVWKCFPELALMLLLMVVPKEIRTPRYYTICLGGWGA